MKNPVAWLCFKPYSPGFMFDASDPAEIFVTQQREVAAFYDNVELFADETKLQEFLEKHKLS
jgi:hypothetical protein